MGYCLFEHWLGAGIGVGTRRGAQAKARGAGARHSDTTRRRWGAAQRHDAQALGAGERGAGERAGGAHGALGCWGERALVARRLGRGLGAASVCYLANRLCTRCTRPVLTQF